MRLSGLKMMNWAGLVFLLFLFGYSQLSGQISIIRNVPILAGINDSTVSVTIDPIIPPEEIAKIFDGNPLTRASIPNGDSVIITLAFEEAPEFSESKVYFLNPGNWTLETANSLDDLNNQTGSYQLLVNNRPFPFLAWDSLGFATLTASHVRLTAVNSWTGNMYFGEWTLETTLNILSLYITPHPPKLLPETNLTVHVKLLDEFNRLHPYNLNDPLMWSSNNPSVATAAGGIIHGVSLGTAQINVHPESAPLSGSATAHVVQDFQSQQAPQKIQKVALVLHDPVTDNGQKLHQRFNWGNPLVLTANLIAEFDNASNNAVHFTIVDTLDDPVLFTYVFGVLFPLDSLVYYYSQPGWGKLKEAEQAGALYYDYQALIDYYDLCTRRNNGEFDEVWVYTHPMSGMYESRLAGPNAFWWNSPPLTGTTCEKLLSMMGFNYERGVAEAMHSVGHRAESALVQAFGRWNIHDPEPNAWELFTTIDKEIPGKGQIGNIHYPVNGLSDYDYSNTNYVITYADNWKRYPYLLDETRTVNCLEWGCGHLGYMRWWYNHLPRYTGVTDSILDNWWMYFLDYEAAVDSAHANSGTVGVEPLNSKRIPRAFLLEQNYPNPFNPITTIHFSIPRAGLVKLKIFDVLGREVKTLVHSRMDPGEYTVDVDASDLASGIYFYRISVSGFSQTRKMVLMK